MLGWLAAGLMVATFSCREARCLRPLAMAANLAFIGYALAADLPPVLALHLLLLPINLWRWAQACREGAAGRPGVGDRNATVRHRTRARPSPPAGRARWTRSLGPRSVNARWPGPRKGGRRGPSRPGVP